MTKEDGLVLCLGGVGVVVDGRWKDLMREGSRGQGGQTDETRMEGEEFQEGESRVVEVNSLAKVEGEMTARGQGQQAESCLGQRPNTSELLGVKLRFGLNGGRWGSINKGKLRPLMRWTRRRRRRIERRRG